MRNKYLEFRQIIAREGIIDKEEDKFAEGVLGRALPSEEVAVMLDFTKDNKIGSAKLTYNKQERYIEAHIKIEKKKCKKIFIKSFYPGIMFVAKRWKSKEGTTIFEEIDTIKTIGVSSCPNPDIAIAQLGSSIKDDTIRIDKTQETGKRFS